MVVVNGGRFVGLFIGGLFGLPVFGVPVSGLLVFGLPVFGLPVSGLPIGGRIVVNGLVRFEHSIDSGQLQTLIRISKCNPPGHCLRKGEPPSH